MELKIVKVLFARPTLSMHKTLNRKIWRQLYQKEDKTGLEMRVKIEILAESAQIFTYIGF